MKTRRRQARIRLVGNAPPKKRRARPRGEPAASLRRRATRADATLASPGEAGAGSTGLRSCVVATRDSGERSGRAPHRPSTVRSTEDASHERRTTIRTDSRPRRGGPHNTRTSPARGPRPRRGTRDRADESTDTVHRIMTYADGMPSSPLHTHDPQGLARRRSITHQTSSRAVHLKSRIGRAAASHRLKPP